MKDGYRRGLDAEICNCKWGQKVVNVEQGEQSAPFIEALGPGVRETTLERSSLWVSRFPFSSKPSRPLPKVLFSNVICQSVGGELLLIDADGRCVDPLVLEIGLSVLFLIHVVVVLNSPNFVPASTCSNSCRQRHHTPISSRNRQPDNAYSRTSPRVPIAW